LKNLQYSVLQQTEHMYSNLRLQSVDVTSQMIGTCGSNVVSKQRLP